MMELITLLLSGLLLIVSPVGIVLDQLAEDAIRDRIFGAEDLAVRIDNAPPLQVLQGKVERVRIAGRGISPVPELRIAVAELETDPIDLNFGQLRQGRVVLDRPLQGALRVVLTPDDLNRFLVSPQTRERLSQIQLRLPAGQSREADRYELRNPQITFLENNRIAIAFDLQDQVLDNRLSIVAAAGLGMTNGHQLVLTEPALTVDGAAAPPQLVEPLLNSVNQQLSLKALETAGVTARILQLQVQPEALELSLWLRVEPSVTASP
ncbi:DUF2993 domain-containing protein [Romeria aff. gracilis LEGE 07310]|uniref:DUF2993 domain-containing protein n=2 Tax=Vasconcelosia TaxID=3366328 RepID=A0A8J7APJ9_9CYAN|nr:DUF2993 domain-containing protein [Romeria aff. gracilis LEGE 07310]